MKSLLIISPFFPPANAADMQRVRTSLPYFPEFGWDVEVVAVDIWQEDISKDDLLLESVPASIEIHRIKPLPKKITSKFGLGSLGLRSLLAYKSAVSAILQKKKIDLIYFSTTQFSVCVLGPYWLKKFGVPYVIDLQDPWHSDYYRDKPKAQRPPKYWLSYRLNKYMEPLAVKRATGLISVSPRYLETLRQRYPSIANTPTSVITFGAFGPDLPIALKHEAQFPELLDDGFTSLVYIGRGGLDMHAAIRPLFAILQKYPQTYNTLKLYFIGTSYAPAGHGKETILPLAREYGIAHQVAEITDRIGYYHALATLAKSDGLFISGSDDPGYTASKIYPYLLTDKPLLAILNPASPAAAVLKAYGVKHVYDYASVSEQEIRFFLDALLAGQLIKETYESAAVDQYSARFLTGRQASFFNELVK